MRLFKSVAGKDGLRCDTSVKYELCLSVRPAVAIEVAPGLCFDDVHTSPSTQTYFIPLIPASPSQSFLMLRAALRFVKTIEYGSMEEKL